MHTLGTYPMGGFLHSSIKKVKRDLYNKETPAGWTQVLPPALSILHILGTKAEELHAEKITSTMLTSTRSMTSHCRRGAITLVSFGVTGVVKRYRTTLRERMHTARNCSSETMAAVACSEETGSAASEIGSHRVEGTRNVG